jgi:hypothetical protein
MAAAAIAARTYARMVYSSCAPIPFRCSDGNGNKIHLFLDCERSGTRAEPPLLPPKGTPPMGYAGPGMVPARSSRRAKARPTRRVDRRRRSAATCRQDFRSRRSAGKLFRSARAHRRAFGASVAEASRMKTRGAYLYKGCTPEGLQSSMPGSSGGALVGSNTSLVMVGASGTLFTCVMPSETIFVS